jgi:hypothetical protein
MLYVHFLMKADSFKFNKYWKKENTRIFEI